MQELGETRVAMTQTLMKRIEGIINEYQKRDDKYWILVHGKPYPNNPKMIKMKYVILPVKPSMMLSCMLFSVDNKSGTLMLEWALPGDWPVWSVNGTNEPVPEVIASYDRLDRQLRYRPGNQFFESNEEQKILA